MKQKTKRILKRALLVLLCITVLGGAVAGIVVATDKVETKGVTATWAIGGLDENGDYQKTDKSIYTKNAFDCNGLKVNLDFDSTIEYQIYFYDFDNEFVSNTEMLQTSFKGEVPMNAKSARIVIRPLKNNDKLNIFNIPSLSGQIEIKVAKEQYESVEERFAQYGNIASMFGKGNLSSGNLTSNASSSFYWTNAMNVSDYDSVIIKIKSSTFTGSVTSGEYSVDAFGVYNNGTKITSGIEEIYTKDGYSYVAVDISGVDTLYVAVDVASADVLEVYPV